MEFITMARKPGGKNNAITNGAYAKDLILPGESVREFNLLHRDLIEEWKPIGTLEQDTVLTLAQGIWQKRRADRFYYRELLWAQQHPDEEHVNDAIWRTEMLGEMTVKELTRITDQFPSLYKHWLERAIPRSDFEDEKSWLESLKSQILDKLVQHKLVILLEIESDKFQAAKAAKVRDLIANKVALDEKLDARIDRAVKRLAQLKAFKQIVAEQTSAERTFDQRSVADHRLRTSANKTDRRRHISSNIFPRHKSNG
jgi:hypothetical protein